MILVLVRSLFTHPNFTVRIGYLINQFLVEKTNQRKDQWGGSLEARQKFPLEIIRRTREVVGPKFILMYRLR